MPGTAEGDPRARFDLEINRGMTHQFSKNELGSPCRTGRAPGLRRGGNRVRLASGIDSRRAMIVGHRAHRAMMRAVTPATGRQVRFRIGQRQRSDQRKADRRQHGNRGCTAHRIIVLRAPFLLQGGKLSRSQRGDHRFDVRQFVIAARAPGQMLFDGQRRVHR